MFVKKILALIVLLGHGFCVIAMQDNNSRKRRRDDDEQSALQALNNREHDAEVAHLYENSEPFRQTVQITRKRSVCGSRQELVDVEIPARITRSYGKIRSHGKNFFDDSETESEGHSSCDEKDEAESVVQERQQEMLQLVKQALKENRVQEVAALISDPATAAILGASYVNAVCEALLHGAL